MASTKTEVLKVVYDLICFFIFVIPLWVYNLLHVVPLNRFGYFCSDNSIRYPYRNSSISSVVLFVSGTVAYIISVCVVELLLYRRSPKTGNTSVFHPLITNIYRSIGYFFIGACVNQFLTDIGKDAIGRPRPHFLDMCQSNVTCTPTNQHVYIENYVCTRTSHPLIPQSDFKKRMSDSRKSFPSGHASFSIYVAVFMVLYLEFRLRSQRTRLVRHLIQTGIVAWAVWVCCSRISDYKHRFSDVAGGLVIGTITALMTFKLFFQSTQCELNKCKRLDDVQSMEERSSTNSNRLNSEHSLKHVTTQ
ncbi:phospholipid phosphatase 1 isoform X1 [Ciona intestinalis]